ncbi:hypothetical protein ACFL6I_22300 [candidate division KSB1 bacterium]
MRVRSLSIVMSMLVLAGFLYSTAVTAQTQTEDMQKANVFLDRFRQFETHIRNEITQVNYVRDPVQAEVYILLTQQQTGGGEEHTLTFTGQETYYGLNDTLRFVSRQDDTEDYVRNRMISYIKMGLIRYISKTGFAEVISINLGEEQRERDVAEQEDKWNYWVFRINGDLNVEGEEQFRELSLGGGISANRITDEWKINLRFNPEYSEDRNETDEAIYRTFSRESRFSGLIVKSITDHWSAGAISEIVSDTRINTDLSLALGSAIEYNIFPYSMSTRRQFTFRWGVWGNETTYREETVFDKLQENLFYSTLSIGTEMIERWGEFESNLEGKLFLHDTSFNKLDWNTRFDIRIIRGLSLDLFGQVSLIHDQLYVAKGGSSIDEILLRRTQLKTNWSYDTRIGISYLFGSPFNNIVNSRFGGVGGRGGGGGRDHY